MKELTYGEGRVKPELHVFQMFRGLRITFSPQPGRVGGCVSGLSRPRLQAGCWPARLPWLEKSPLEWKN